MERDQSPSGVGPGILCISDLPARLIARLTEKHLVFETSCTTKLRLGTESGPGAPLDSPAARTLAVVNRMDHGKVGVLGMESLTPVEEDRYDFIVISEAQYLRYEPERFREEDEDDAVYFWYNVMLVEWDISRTITRRLGFGRVAKRPGG